MAKKFNLQPWRERLRAEQKKTFTNITVILVILLVGLVFFDKYNQDNYVVQQYNSIETLKGEIEGLKRTQEEIDRLKKLNEEVQTQVDAINVLQSQRGFVVELMDFIAKNTPDSVFLTTVEYGNSQSPGSKPGDKEVIVEGVVENSAGVSEFMRAMAKWDRLGEARLDRRGITTAYSTEAFNIDADNPEIKAFKISIPVLSAVKPVDKEKN